MFRQLLNKLRFLRQLKIGRSKEVDKKTSNEKKLAHDLEKNLTFVKNILGSSKDIVTRRFVIPAEKEVRAAIIFIDGLVEKVTIHEDILRPLIIESQKKGYFESLNKKELLAAVEQKILTVDEIKRVNTFDLVIEGILSGDTALIMEGSDEAFLLGTRRWETRGVEEPETEVVVRGPREGFTETLRVNTSLLRRKIRNPNLIFETMTLGRQTKTIVCIAYVKGIANDLLIEEIKERLKRIETDAILESGYIEQYIEDAPFSVFPTIGNSEKPDTVAAKMLEGRAAILIDGTPMVLTVPMLFVEVFQTPEDYYSRPIRVSLLRWVRYTAFVFSILTPGIYIALATFHHELIPTPLLITMAASVEGTPFPAFIALVIMGLIFEILREAGIRMPRPVGQAVSIVGALVIGEAAVSAGLVSAPVVIVIAITAIASFVSPPLESDAGPVLRIFFSILAGGLGAFGLMIGVLVLLIYLASLRSFGVPYLSPIAPLSLQDLKDVIIRFPLWAMFTRPRTIGWHNPRRQKFGMLPGPPSEEKKEEDFNENPE